MNKIINVLIQFFPLTNNVIKTSGVKLIKFV